MKEDHLACIACAAFVPVRRLASSKACTSMALYWVNVKQSWGEDVWGSTCGCLHSTAKFHLVNSMLHD